MFSDYETFHLHDCCKLGFKRIIARVVLYGFHKYGSFNFSHLWVGQGFLGVKHLLGHLRKMTNVGESIMIALSYAQVVSKSSHLYLKNVSSGMPYVPATWLSTLRTFLAACNASYKQGPIISESLDLSRFIRKLRQLHTVMGSNRSETSISNMPLAKLRTPVSIQLGICQNFIQTSFTNLPKYTRINKHWKLSIVLGRWTTTTPLTLCKFYYSPINATLYVNQNGSFASYRCSLNRRTLFQSTDETITELPTDAN
jgi:hypothetical protein